MQIEHCQVAPELAKLSRPVSAAKSGKSSVKSSGLNQRQVISSKMDNHPFREPDYDNQIYNHSRNLDEISKRSENVESKLREKIIRVKKEKSRASENIVASKEHFQTSDNVHSSYLKTEKAVKNVIEEPNINRLVSRDCSIRHENEIMPDIHWHDIAATSIAMPRSPIDQKTVRKFDSSQQKIVEQNSVKNSFPEVDFVGKFESSKQKMFEQISMTLPPERKIVRKVSKVELSDASLQKILSQKHPQKQKDNDNFDLFEFQSVQVVTNLSCKLADEILNSICHEMIDSDLISKLISSELKG